MTLVTEDKCPDCRRKKLRAPGERDPVYIMTRDAVVSASVEDILAQNGIPCIKRGQLGAGIVAYLGYTMESFRIYVPFGAYGTANDLLSNFLEQDSIEQDDNGEREDE